VQKQNVNTVHEYGLTNVIEVVRILRKGDAGTNFYINCWKIRTKERGFI
jgi:hypothetical protein